MGGEMDGRADQYRKLVDSEPRRKEEKGTRESTRVSIQVEEIRRSNYTSGHSSTYSVLLLL